ncbi:MAG: shikimate dehydrogenase [Bacteroidia bacterium]
MKTFGLIGFPLHHTFSEKYFSDKFQREKIAGCEYKIFPLQQIEELPVLIKNLPELIGLNVTIPYKQAVLPFLDELDPLARNVGAVNTIKILRNGNKFYLKGFNTDAYAFQQSIKPLLKLHHKAALILGNGGAAKAIQRALIYGLEIDHIMFVSRKSGNLGTLRYDELNEKTFDYYKLIINTTPVGMYPDVNTFPPVPYHHLTPLHLLYDLVYNPAETAFLKKGKENGAHIKNGLEMLYLQAEEAWKIWNRNEIKV